MPADALTAADRCDRCGARAAQRVEFAASDLLFCGHHYREHEAKLISATLDALDGTALTAVRYMTGMSDAEITDGGGL